MKILNGGSVVTNSEGGNWHLASDLSDLSLDVPAAGETATIWGNQWHGGTQSSAWEDFTLMAVLNRKVKRTN